MPINYHLDDISLFSIKKDLQGYSWNSLKCDVFAALNVALLTVPQAMAYALLTGLPLACSVFASIFSATIAAIFGSSKHLINGQSNGIAILIQAGTAEILLTYYRDITGIEREIISIQILAQISLLVGFMQVLAAIFRLGGLTQFVSHSVVMGYVIGATAAVVINQLYVFFGMGSPESGSLYERAFYFISNFNEIHLPTALMGVFSMLLFLGLRYIDKRIPAAVVTLAACALALHLINLIAYHGYFTSLGLYLGDAEKAIMVVGDLGEMSPMGSVFAWPYFNAGLMNHVLPVAFAIALLGVLETTSVSKSVAAASGQRLSLNQEIFGLGLGNLFSSFVSAVPIAGSTSRSMTNFNNGGLTRFAAIFNGIFVALLISFFGFFVTKIPLASLAAFLLITALQIVNKQHFCMCFKATSSDALVMAITICACLFFSFDIAFYIGIVLSIILYLKKAALPQLVEYEIDESGELHHVDFAKKQSNKTIRVIKVEGELFFGAADLFQTTLKSIAEDDTSIKVIILQLKNARDIDATTCLALERLHGFLTSSGRHLIMCGMTLQVWEVLSDSGLVQQIGKKNLFIFDERHPHSYMHKAIHRAKNLINVPVKPIAGEVVEVAEAAEAVESPTVAPEKSI